MMKVLVIVIGLVFSISIQAQTILQEKKTEEKKKPVLEVKLSIFKPVVCVGEETVWRYELTNLTEQTMRFYTPYLYNNWLFGHYKTEDEKTKDKTNRGESFINHVWPRVDPEIHKLVVLEPNVTQIETVKFSSKSELVEKAGKYKYQVFVQGVESNELIFEVVDCGQVKTEKQK